MTMREEMTDHEGHANTIATAAHKQGYIDGLEKALAVMEGDFDSEMRAYAGYFAASIRSLIKEAKND